jgi:hypothetical protein
MSILPYIENMPIDIKLSLSRRIFAQKQKNLYPINLLPTNDRMGQKTISRYYPFKRSGWFVETHVV